MSLPEVEMMSLKDLLSARAEMTGEVMPMLEVVDKIGIGSPEVTAEARSFLSDVETELTKHGMHDTSQMDPFVMNLEEVQMELSGLGVYGEPDVDKVEPLAKSRRIYDEVTVEMKRITSDGGDRRLLLQGRQILLTIEAQLTKRGETL
jgi:hypothetical protein